VFNFLDAKLSFKKPANEILKFGCLMNYKAELEYMKPNFTNFSFSFLLIGDELGYLEYILQYIEENH